MTRYIQKNEEKNPTIAFIFLFLYTVSVLIRPHEMFLVSVEWINIKVFSILCFITLLLAQRPLKLYPQHWMLLGLLPLIAVSGFLNGSGWDGIEYVKTFFVGTIIPLFLFSNGISTLKRQHVLMVVSLIAALLMVHNGYIQQTSNLNYGWALDTRGLSEVDIIVKRITYLGFFNDPNDLGMFLVMNIPFTIYFFSKGNFFTKLLMLAILSALGYGVYLTGSRGTMLGAGGLIGIYYLVTKAGPRLFLSAVLFAPIAATALLSLKSNMDESAANRLDAWYDGVLMLLHNPVFGVGKGQFLEEHGIVAHNSYIQIAAELGVPGYSLWGGALIFTVLTGYLFIKARKKIQVTKTKEVIELEDISQECQDELTLNKTLFFSMVGFIITGFFITRTYSLLLFIFIGMTVASHNRVIKLMPKYQQYFNTNIAIRCMLSCWLVIGAVYLALKMGLR